MSAIFGLFHFDRQPVTREDFSPMVNVLQPYGPEGSSIWYDNHVGFGHCLMCFTPEDALEQQEQSSSDLKLVFSGRIDNRNDLLTGLSISAEEVKSLTDSAFVLMAYKKWGEDCFQKLIGRFTCALWDENRQILLVVRSAVNGPPLFYHVTPKTLAFASMRKGLLVLPQVPRHLDEQVLADYLTRIPIDPGKGFYEDIQQLPSGHVLRVNLDGIQIKRFWQLDLSKTIHFPHEDDYVEAFNDLFTRVVSDYLRSETPLGIMMSGGLDSSSVAAVAAPLLKTRGESLTAFTEVPAKGFDAPMIEGRYADETPYVQAIAEMYDNLRLNPIRTDGQVYLDELEKFFTASEVPFRNASNRVYIEAILKAAHEQGIRNLLTGGQGNLTISWKGSGLLPQLIKQGHFMRALNEARALARNGFSRSGMRTLFNQGLKPLLPESMWLAAQYLLHRDVSARKAYAAKAPWQEYSPVHPDFTRKHQVFERALEKGHDFLGHRYKDTRSVRLRVLENSGKLFDGLDLGYESMYRVATRDPTTDQRLVEFCLRIPEELFLRHGIPKWLIRKTMEGRLPDEVIFNRKRGLQAADWYERLLGAKPIILETLNLMENSELACRAIDLPRLRRLVDAMPSIGANPQKLMLDYRQVLESGLMTGSFIVWFELGNWR